MTWLSIQILIKMINKLFEKYKENLKAVEIRLQGVFLLVCLPYCLLTSVLSIALKKSKRNFFNKQHMS